ncbi:MAG: PilW family protein [Pseudomonadota bacterium]
MSRMRQRGLTVVELLIAATLGLLVVLMAATMLVASNAAFVAQAEAAGVDDAGRFALAVIERAARQSAFIDWEREDVAAGIDPAAPPAVRGLDAASLSSSSAALADPRPPAVNGSDVLALRFAGSGAGDGDGSATTCAGFSVGAGQDGWSIFYVGAGSGGEPELRCKFRGANNWSAEAVIGGIDSFQVLYGLDTDAVPDGVANVYLSASEVNAREDTLAIEGASEQERQRERQRKSWWKRVASIKVSLVVHGARQSHQVGGPALYMLFGAGYNNGADAGTRVKRADMSPALTQRERRMFSSTILLRNPLRPSP